MGIPLIVCLSTALLGAAVMSMALGRSRRVAPEFGAFLDGLAPSDHATRVSVPFTRRMADIVVQAAGRRVERLLPRTYLDGVDNQLAQAGISADRSAGEQVARQLGLAVVGALSAVVLRPYAHSLTTMLALLFLPVMGWMVATARLKRAIEERAEAIFKDLPDIIDMLAVAVEAGSGFEAALSIVCKHFRSPMADELEVVLREMELGLPRRAALQELKRRLDIDVVRTFVLALVQADALGIPIGRVLKTQASEVRARRRAWARERAGKLPVKILFPLVLFIFPPILAIALGPAVSSFSQLK